TATCRRWTGWKPHGRSVMQSSCFTYTSAQSLPSFPLSPSPGSPPQDCHMPEMDGLEATRQIRNAEQLLPSRPPKFIAALTASAFDFEREACFAAGMNHFLTKPIRPKDLEDLVMKLVEMRK
ncbi:unnamed protein product, partial [Closterium sp. NIES-54]